MTRHLATLLMSAAGPPRWRAPRILLPEWMDHILSAVRAVRRHRRPPWPLNLLRVRRASEALRCESCRGAAAGRNLAADHPPVRAVTVLTPFRVETPVPFGGGAVSHGCPLRRSGRASQQFESARPPRVVGGTWRPFARWPDDGRQTRRYGRARRSASFLLRHSQSRFKRVIVTPAVYPRLVEFLHFDIQSTGQKSHCVNILWDHHNALF